MAFRYFLPRRPDSGPTTEIDTLMKQTVAATDPIADSPLRTTTTVVTTPPPVPEPIV